MSSSNSNILERKRGDIIKLKTNLEDAQINPKLYKVKRLSVSELINQPAIVKKKFSIKSFAGAMRKGLQNTSSMIRGRDLNRTEADLTPFNTMEVLSESSFNSNPLESARTTYSTKSNKLCNLNKMTRQKSENTFKMLMKEDYSGYIKILKRIYPSFKFNHYNRISNEYYEYYKKYGEEGDINNRNYIKTDIPKKAGDYKKSNLLDILGVQENIIEDPSKFKIKSDFLSRSDPYELQMIKEDLSFKTGVIDKELNHILESEANILYNYIENNIDLKNQINDFSIEMRRKMEYQRILSKKYILNSAKLFLKENKKKQIKKLLIPLKILNELGFCMKQLKIISESDNDNKIKQISDSTNVAKEKVKLLKKYGIKNQKGNLMYEIENKLTSYENQGELRLNDQLAENLERLFNLTLIYNKDEEKHNVIIVSSDDKNNKKTYNLILEKEDKITFIYNENDFELINENIYIKYLLIYNNNKINNKIYKLLISILDMFDIIIKDNMDFSSIFDICQNLFKKIITKNFELIEKISSNKFKNIEIISNCYSIILSNFIYILQLIHLNFGLNGKKIFIDVIEKMKNEMDEFIKVMIQAYLHEQILDIENSWTLFLKEIKNTKMISNIYFQNSKLKWNEMNMNLYQDYIENFNELKTKGLTEKYNELYWDQITNINEKYQLMFDILNTNQNINKLTIEPEEIILINNKEESNKNNSEVKSEFLIIQNEKNDNDKKHKISKFSYEYIKYAYEYLVIYTSSPEELRDNIITTMMKFTRDMLSYSKGIIFNEVGKINDKEITEKETALYYSDLIIIQKCLKSFIDAKNYGNNLLTCIKEAVDNLNSLKNDCYDALTQLTQGVVTSFIEDFNTLNFNNYKTFENPKEYNLYTKKLAVFKKLYDNIGNSFLVEDINKIFTKIFDNLFNQFKQSVNEKGIIEKDDQLKQFRNELNYIKKVFKLFSLIDCNKYKEIIDELIINVNPKKLPKKKKKQKHTKEEDKNDENED